MTQSELAREAGITNAAISQYENGLVRPPQDTVRTLAKALRFPLRFLVPQNGPGAGEELDGYFRSLRSTSAFDRRRALARAQLLSYFARVLELRVRLPECSLPQQHAVAAAARGEIETIAALIRDRWNMPRGPVGNMVRTLEQHGILVARLAVDTDKVDAFSVPFPDRPVIILGSDKGDRARSRFDAAHELGHLVMHRQLAPGASVIENQAHWFAAAFLMPEKEIRSELPGRVDWGVLQDLKRNWGVSIASLLFRARDLGIMSEVAYVQAMKAMSARGWRRREPVYLGPPEAPALIGRAVEVLRNGGVSLEDLTDQSDLPLDEVSMFVGAGRDSRPSVEL